MVVDPMEDNTMIILEVLKHSDPQRLWLPDIRNLGIAEGPMKESNLPRTSLSLPGS